MNTFSDLLIFFVFFFYRTFFKFGFHLWLFFPLLKRYCNYKLGRVGIRVNGGRKCDIKILDENVYYRMAEDWDLGLMEGYIKGEVEIKDMLAFTSTVFKTRRNNEIKHPLTWIFNRVNLQTRKKAFETADVHYDSVGLDVFQPMMDEHMQYSCGYWKDADNLHDAQTAKLHLIAKKLGLKKGMRLLDVGCGWGGLAKFMAKNYHVSVVGITVSKEQKAFADKLCEGLDVKIRLQDYRMLNEKFDRAVSVGMFEHVGPLNHDDYFDTILRCLKDEGLFLLHCMGASHPSTPRNCMFLHKYVFRNASIPYNHDITRAVFGKFVIEDWHNFGADYGLTAAAWYDAFLKFWPQVEKKYGPEFFRIWTILMKAGEASYVTRTVQLWQVVLSKDGVVGGYRSIR